MSSSKAESLNFHAFDSIKLTFTKLSIEIFKLLRKEENFLDLKLTCERAIIDAQLPEYFSKKVKSCGNTNDLISVLNSSPYWSCIDIRLMETVTAISDKATDMLRQYKEYLMPQNLIDHLSDIPAIPEDIKVNYKILKIKIQKPISLVMEDFFRYRDILEVEILSLKVGACILTHIDKGTSEIDWLIPTEICLHAFESAKRNSMDFDQLFLHFVHIESCDVVFSGAIHQVTSYVIEYIYAA